jgi:hypothetical protein
MMCAISPVSLALAFPLARHVIDERCRGADQARLARAARRNAALPHAPDTQPPTPSRQQLDMPRDCSPAAHAAPGAAAQGPERASGHQEPDLAVPLALGRSGPVL